MGWKSVDRLDIGKGGKRDQYRGKKPDKLGRWHSADVRHYSTNPAGAYLIAPRMKELALWERYVKELSKMSRTKGLLLVFHFQQDQAISRCHTVRSVHRTERWTLTIVGRLYKVKLRHQNSAL
jgi:hypothetical protein